MFWVYSFVSQRGNFIWLPIKCTTFLLIPLNLASWFSSHFLFYCLFLFFLASSLLIQVFLASVIFWEKSPVGLISFYYRLPHEFRILTVYLQCCQVEKGRVIHDIFSAKYLKMYDLLKTYIISILFLKFKFLPPFFISYHVSRNY